MDCDNFMLLQVSKCGDCCIMITNMMAGAKWYEDGDVVVVMMMTTTITVTNEDDNDFNVNETSPLSIAILPSR